MVTKKELRLAAQKCQADRLEKARNKRTEKARVATMLEKAKAYGLDQKDDLKYLQFLPVAYLEQFRDGEINRIGLQVLLAKKNMTSHPSLSAAALVVGVRGDQEQVFCVSAGPDGSAHGSVQGKYEKEALLFRRDDLSPNNVDMEIVPTNPHKVAKKGTRFILLQLFDLKVKAAFIVNDAFEKEGTETLREAVKGGLAAFKEYMASNPIDYMRDMTGQGSQQDVDAVVAILEEIKEEKKEEYRVRKTAARRKRSLEKKQKRMQQGARQGPKQAAKPRAARK